MTTCSLRPTGTKDVPSDLSQRPLLREFWRAVSSPHRQFQADRLGEQWIQELRAGRKA